MHDLPAHVGERRAWRGMIAARATLEAWLLCCVLPGAGCRADQLRSDTETGPSPVKVHYHGKPDRVRPA